MIKFGNVSIRIKNKKVVLHLRLLFLLLRLFARRGAEAAELLRNNYRNRHNT
jgi:hypothetical protein